MYDTDSKVPMRAMKKKDTYAYTCIIKAGYFMHKSCDKLGLTLHSTYDEYALLVVSNALQHCIYIVIAKQLYWVCNITDMYMYVRYI